MLKTYANMLSMKYKYNTNNLFSSLLHEVMVKEDLEPSRFNQQPVVKKTACCDECDTIKK